MTPDEIAKKKYMDLMVTVEDLEDQLEGFSGSDAEKESLTEKLIDAKNELARVSDGCGTPHHH